MRKATKIWLATAALLVALGLILFAAVMTVNHWDFTKLSTVKYETNTYQASGKFRNISMKTDTADIRFAASDDGICRMVCYEQENAKHSIAVHDDTLTIHVVNEKKWYDNIGISTGTPTITIYLPKTEYDVLSINESTGDIEIPNNFKFEHIDISVDTGDIKCNASASRSIKFETSTGYIQLNDVSSGEIDLSTSTGNIMATTINCDGNVGIRVSTGKTELTDVACKNITSTGSTGDISLENVIATEKFSIERSTGDVKFDGCDATKLVVKTDTGDVSGSLLTDKIFIVETDTGSVDVPTSVTGGTCEINTNTGDIDINVV